AALFLSTPWTIVLEAGDDEASSRQSLSALSELCRIYWRPLYLFLRREGFGPDDAQDLTQGFFADLIEARAYTRADREKGRFRSFLLGALKQFVASARATGQFSAKKCAAQFLIDRKWTKSCGIYVKCSQPNEVTKCWS